MATPKAESCKHEHGHVHEHDKPCKKHKCEHVKDLEKSFETMQTLFETFVDDHQAFIEKGNKTAGARARKTINEIKKLITGYRKLSVEITKELKKDKKD